jgi:hypothetical protein
MRKPESLEKKIVTIAFFVITLVLTISFFYPVLSKKPDFAGKKVASNGVVTSRNEIEVYWDEKGTRKVSSLNWGSLEPGMNKTIIVFIKNNNKHPITLAFYTSNCSPTKLETFFDLNWDYDRHNLQFKEIVQVVFTLSLSKNVETAGTFSFDITFVGG